jgi:hypothetical protein
MNSTSKIMLAQYLGHNITPELRKLGPYNITEQTAPEYFSRLYSILDRLGCTYKERGLMLDKGTLSSLIRGGTVADNPVTILTAPSFGAEKWEYHRRSELIGWPIADFGDLSDLVLVNVGGPDSMEFYVSGMAGKRFRAVEAAVRMTFRDANYI